MRILLRFVLVIFGTCVLFPAPASAGWLHDVGSAVGKAASDAGNAVAKAATDTGEAVGGAVSAGRQVVAATGDGLKTLAGGGVRVLRGASELATGHPGDAWATVKEGGQEIINGVVDVVVADGTAAVTMADPLIGRIVFGTPSAMQAIAKFIYETIENWKGRATCNPAFEVERFMKIPKKDIDERSRVGGAATTPIKYILSIFDLPSAWKDTGCNGGGIGRPVRAAQHSLDNFYTVDVAVSAVQVGDRQVPPGRYVRLEIFPGLASYGSVERRLPGPNDVIRFSGPLLWDKDTDTDHPDGHMEIHPTSSIDFGASAPVKNSSSSSTSAGGQTAPRPANQTGIAGTSKGRSNRPVGPVPIGAPTSGPANIDIGAALAGNKPKIGSGSAEYTVGQGDNLSTIAVRLYGKQQWEILFCANRKLIRNPDLIYPGQMLTAPIMLHGVARCDLRNVPRSLIAKRSYSARISGIRKRKRHILTLNDCYGQNQNCIGKLKLTAQAIEAQSFRADTRRLSVLVQFAWDNSMMA